LAGTTCQCKLLVNQPGILHVTLFSGMGLYFAIVISPDVTSGGIGYCASRFVPHIHEAYESCLSSSRIIPGLWRSCSHLQSFSQESSPIWVSPVHASFRSADLLVHGLLVPHRRLSTRFKRLISRVRHCFSANDSAVFLIPLPHPSNPDVRTFHLRREPVLHHVVSR
jgi:hypothetical protein